MIFIGILLMLVLFGGMGAAMWYALKKTDPKTLDTSTHHDIETSQDFLPFVDIQDEMIDLGNHQYRMVLECTSINYDLKTAEEKYIIESGYGRFLNSLSFPISIFISTVEIDNKIYLEKLKADYDRTVQETPALFEYVHQNYQDMKQLNRQLGVTRQKKKYIIIPYDEANELTMQTEEEKYNNARKELYGRAHIVQDALLSLSIEARVLSDTKLMDLIVRTYHRNGVSHAAEIVNGDYTNFLVDGNFLHVENLTTAAQFDLFLDQMEAQIKNRYLSQADEGDMEKNAHQLLQYLAELRMNSETTFKKDVVAEYKEEKRELEQKQREAKLKGDVLKNEEKNQTNNYVLTKHHDTTSAIDEDEYEEF